MLIDVFGDEDKVGEAGAGVQAADEGCGEEETGGGVYEDLGI